MLPKLTTVENSSTLHADFIHDLVANGFQGDVSTAFNDRLVVATDNSIYQIIPNAIVFPKYHQDVVILAKLAANKNYHELTFSPRGGGTGTNGQSLTTGMVIDFSRYMNHILEVNLEKGYVRVQPGVVLDQLNEFLELHQVCFAASLAPSNRATIGGMVATDASGEGSLRYGKTSQHILSLTLVMINGEVIHTENSDSSHLLSEKIKPLLKDNYAYIQKNFPKLHRFLSGYNLEKGYVPATDTVDLNYLLAGSEGSLALVTEIKLRLTSIPKHKCMFAVSYESFDHALRSAAKFLSVNPSAIETIDDNLVQLAKSDVLYDQVKDFIDAEAMAVNLIEVTSDSNTELKNTITQIKSLLENKAEHGIQSYSLTDAPSKINALWQFRKKAVGLLGRLGGDRQPMPFVEDTIVPPEHLADYIQEFRKILDAHQLQYGMFGHSDVGCLHVRPALDLTNQDDVTLISDITHQVIGLLKKYGGVLWGEHGKGYRSEFVPHFFGKELYFLLRLIKTIFDPHNQLNPGKIATSIHTNTTLSQIEATNKGSYDRQVDTTVREDFKESFRCNGNAACFNYAVNDLMCPSYKVTQNRIHSPKGRANLFREWQRKMSQEGVTLNAEAIQKLKSNWLAKLFNSVSALFQKQDFSDDVREAMDGCLGCKACARECPIQVNIPRIRTYFYRAYYANRLMPLRNLISIYFDSFALKIAKFPRIINFASASWLGRGMLKLIKMEALPKFSSPSIHNYLPSKANDQNMVKGGSSKTVGIVLDPFTASFEAHLYPQLKELIAGLGFQCVLLPYSANGKAAYNFGHLSLFKKTVLKTNQHLRHYQNEGLELIGLEASTTLCFRDEYLEFSENSAAPIKVFLLQEWLTEHIGKLKNQRRCESLGDPSLASRVQDDRGKIYLVSHCTEKTLVNSTDQLWQKIFFQLNIDLEIIKVGCCGMAGMYGYESEHFNYSQQLFNTSWQPLIGKYQLTRDNFMATGFSCRHQVERFAGFKPLHPVEFLLRLVQGKQ